MGKHIGVAKVLVLAACALAIVLSAIGLSVNSTQAGTDPPRQKPTLISTLITSNKQLRSLKYIQRIQFAPQAPLCAAGTQFCSCQKPGFAATYTCCTLDVLCSCDPVSGAAGCCTQSDRTNH